MNIAIPVNKLKNFAYEVTYKRTIIHNYTYNRLLLLYIYMFVDDDVDEEYGRNGSSFIKNRNKDRRKINRKEKQSK